uniref:LAGLIDADG-2 homing endonuclease n=1 Tax=Ankistrodesmus falcatus TaxID=52960 RepID=A0A7L7K5V6_9CHLO|nr:LAGLIDADG-2 homing endonuclease [Ankistrodesmus falcatus]QMS48920.1 LAGLIDADG-2 homing endonuclease [Ankistrodesmus falcatus]
MDVGVSVFAFFLGGIPLKSMQRIGPHNKDVLCVIFGSLLGDAYAEKRANSTRICFQPESSHVGYLYWLHKFFAERGYCNPNKPKLSRRIVKNGKVRFVLRFKTWSFQSLNWMHAIFYENNTKKVPSLDLLETYLTSQAMAIWIMDEGTSSGKGLTLATHSFNLEDLLFLQTFFQEKYHWKVGIHKSGYENQYVIYVYAESMHTLAKAVKPYMVESMYYKLGSNGSSL